MEFNSNKTVVAVLGCGCSVATGRVAAASDIPVVSCIVYNCKCENYARPSYYVTMSCMWTRRDEAAAHLYSSSISCMMLMVQVAMYQEGNFSWINFLCTHGVNLWCWDAW